MAIPAASDDLDCCDRIGLILSEGRRMLTRKEARVAGRAPRVICKSVAGRHRVSGRRPSLIVAAVTRLSRAQGAKLSATVLLPQYGVRSIQLSE